MLMEPFGRTLRRRLLGRELKRAREAAGLSVRSLAPLAKLQPGTISKIENGRQAILPRSVLLIGSACALPDAEVQRLVTIAEQEERDTWWSRYGDTAVPSWFRDYVDLESDADRIETYSAELVDGLLQTPAYAEAVARVTEPEFTEDQMKAAVELREARQDRLMSNEGPQVHVVLGEAVLRRPFGSPAVMREQLRHLADVGTHDRITIQVLPFEAGGHPAVKGSFTVLKFGPDLHDVDSVYLENENDGVWQDQPSDLARYAAIFTRLTDMSLSPQDTRTFLTTLAG